MKILQVSPYYSPNIGGIQTQVKALSEELVKAGHRVTVYTSNVPKSKKYEIINGVEIYRFKSLFSLLNNHFVPGYLSKLMSNNFDVIHMHGALHLSSNTAAFSNIFKKSPSVLTTHGATVDYQGWKGIIEGFYHKTIGKWMFNSVDKIIALSRKEVDLLENLGTKPSKITVIPNGIQLNQINSQQTDVQQFKDFYQLNSRNIILFVGLLIPRKGVEYLIDAGKYIKSNPIILIVGDDPQGHLGNKRALQQRVKNLELENKVLFVGNLTEKNLGLAYLACDIFVLPSLAEGLPVTLLEAMAYAKCPIVTDIPGNSDVIRDNENGILVQPRNAVQLAEKIDYLLENPHVRKQLGENAITEVENKYTLEVMVKKTLDVYNEVINSAKQ